MRRALIPYYTNPGGFNLDAILVLIGATAWFICIIGEAYGFAVMPPTLAGVGPFITGIGVGGARKSINRERK